jgi:hypothetical protein
MTVDGVKRALLIGKIKFALKNINYKILLSEYFQVISLSRKLSSNLLSHNWFICLIAMQISDVFRTRT